MLSQYAAGRVRGPSCQDGGYRLGGGSRSPRRPSRAGTEPGIAPGGRSALHPVTSPEALGCRRSWGARFSAGWAAASVFAPPILGRLLPKRWGPLLCDVLLVDGFGADSHRESSFNGPRRTLAESVPRRLPRDGSVALIRASAPDPPEPHAPDGVPADSVGAVPLPAARHAPPFIRTLNPPPERHRRGAAPPIIK